MNTRLKPLLSLPFIICLTLLLVNDLYLKDAFHNAFTGKLSDFCGLFIFPIFWSALFPARKSLIFILSGILFIYWKSEYSRPLIESVSHYLFAIQRTVDYTDLIALPALIIAWFALNNNTKNVDMHRVFRFVGPYPVAILTIFSFCATSKARYVQTFDQPQYVLFKSDILPDTSDLENDFRFYQFDSLLVVQVNQLQLNDRPARNDDYAKNLAVKDLDKNVSGMIPGIKNLMQPGQVTALTIRTPEGDDHVQFNGGRLDGVFIRTKDGKVLIDGTYKAGFEDSIWTFKNIADRKVRKVTFVNGERTGIQNFNGSDLVSYNKVSTRAVVNRNKIIQIVVLSMLMIGAFTMIVINYRRRSQEKLQIALASRWLACLLLPIWVWALQLAIIYLSGDYQFDLLFMPVMIIIVYVVTFPLFLIIVFGIKLSRPVDVLWYSLLFAFAFSIWIEWDILSALSV